MKKILFVHNNFPAQFKHVARTLARTPDVKVAAIGSQTARTTPGIKLLKYTVNDGDVAATHPFARRFDLECRRAEQVLYAASSLVASGFMPDVVVGHPGWGETLPLRAIFPKSRIITYCELFYQIDGQDVGFDPEFPHDSVDSHVRIHLKNAATLLALDHSDAGIAPTHWQKASFPQQYRDKIAVVHEGVDVEAVKPDASASFQLPSGRVLRQKDEVVTFVARAFEPLRGFHIFMRALPAILAARPQAEVVIIGGAGQNYGQSPIDGRDWKSIFCAEIAGRADMSRVHFTGPLPYATYLKALQVSRAHIYFTYPFVLSWSLVEAMSSGCLVLASDTGPLKEVIDGSNGILIPFFDVKTLARHTIEALAAPRKFQLQRKRARATVVERFDVKRICLPRMLELLGVEADSADTDSAPRVPLARPKRSAEHVKGGLGAS
jgi:glycosyltransferase involved in cell wall biosynthesis